MAQVLTTTSNVSGISVSNLQSQITLLRSRFAQGNAVLADNVNMLVALWNAWITHNHTATDQIWVAFGDGVGSPVVPNVSSSFARTSASVKGPVTSTAGVSIGQTIAAMHQQVAADGYNAIRSHTHIIGDSWLP